MDELQSKIILNEQVLEIYRWRQRRDFAEFMLNRLKETTEEAQKIVEEADKEMEEEDK